RSTCSDMAELLCLCWLCLRRPSRAPQPLSGVPVNRVPRLPVEEPAYLLTGKLPLLTGKLLGLVSALIMSRSRSSSTTIELLSFIFLSFPSPSRPHFLVRSLRPLVITVNRDLAVLHSSSRMHPAVIVRGRRPMVSDIPVATSERRAFWMYWTSTT